MSHNLRPAFQEQNPEVQDSGIPMAETILPHFTKITFCPTSHLEGNCHIAIHFRFGSSCRDAREHYVENLLHDNSMLDKMRVSYESVVNVRSSYSASYLDR